MAALAPELDRVSSKRVAIVTGSTLASSSDVLDKVCASVGDRDVFVLDCVKKQSPIDAVEAVARKLLEAGADAIIALGGGSAIVTARAANIIAAEDRPLLDMCSKRSINGEFNSPVLKAPKLPQFVIPTTPTTAMLKAGSGVVDTITRQRHTMFDPKTRARAIFIQPEFALTAPTHLVKTASLNILAMAVEGIASDGATPISDGFLLQSLRLISQNLPYTDLRSDDPRLRCELMLAALLCGQGTDDAPPGIAAALGHTFGEQFNVANGAANAVLLPHTMRFNQTETADRLPKIAAALGVLGSCPISAVESLLGTARAPSKLRDLGVAQSGLGKVPALAWNDWFFHKNPRKIKSDQEIIDLLQLAW